MALELYWGSGSPYAWRVMLAFEIKQIPYESKVLRFTDEDLKSAEYLAINPRGRVPAIRDGSFTLYESIAILAYLEDKYPSHSLFGKDADERGQVWCSMMDTDSFIEPELFRFAVPIFYNVVDEKREEVIQARQIIEKEFTRLNDVLSESDYLVNGRLSAADISVYPFIKFYSRAAMKENTEEVSGALRDIGANYPSLQAWCKRIETIPGYERTYPPHWK
jgi:glutathione S-transferase